jgi:predicted MFS family arabinose efflux permease
MDDIPAATPKYAAQALGVFAHPAFAMIWFANLAALIGVAMYDAASGWMMVEFGADPGLVSMLRTAINLPIFLVTLIAGAMADLFDARRLLIVISAGIGALVAIFGLAVALGIANTALLLTTTFLLSAAVSLAAPAWLAIAPRLVAPQELPGVMAANGIGYNLSRAVGPALGGFAINQFGVTAPLAFLVAANLAVWAALAAWRPKPMASSSLPAERLTSAVRTGLRHALNNKALRITLIRTIAIYPFAAAYWGLLPVIAERIHPMASFYGVLLSAISVGTILGSVAQRLLRSRLGDDEIVALGSVATGLALGGFAFARDTAETIAVCLVAGAGWVMVLASLYASAERTLAVWVRARGLAVFLTVVFGAMTLGSAAWGYVAQWEGLHLALILAAACAFAGIPLTWNWRMNVAESADLSPSGHWRVPETSHPIENSRGPVLVKIDYRIDPARRGEFLRAMDELSFERRRDGAFGWGIFEDANANGRFEEGYLVESWLELLHFRERVTKADLALEEEIRQLLSEPPHIEFLVSAESERGLFRPSPLDTEA